MQNTCTGTHTSCTMQTQMVIQMQTKEANEKPYKHICNHGYKTHIDMHVHEAPLCYRRSISLKRPPVLHKKHQKKPSSSSSSPSWSSLCCRRSIRRSLTHHQHKGWCKNYLLPGFLHISNPCCQLRSDCLPHFYVLPPWRIPVSWAIETDSTHLWTQYKHDARILGSGSLPVACTADCGHKVSHTPASSHMLHWRGPLHQGEIHWRLSSHWFQASIL